VEANVGILIAVIKDERVIELIPLREKDIERDCDKMVDVSDPQFKDLKVGDPWPSRETVKKMKDSV
jgi:hypothetical protein